MAEMGWLSRYLDSAVDKGLCVKIYCTTCGARQFQEELASEVNQHLSMSGSGLSKDDAVLLLVGALAGLSTPSSDQARTKTLRRNEALRFILFNLNAYFARQGEKRSLDQLLGDSWAGNTLTAMRAHYQADKRRWLENARRTNPSFVAYERERKRGERALKHAERVRRKQARDARLLGIRSGHAHGDLLGESTKFAALLLQSVHPRRGFDRDAVLRKYIARRKIDEAGAGRTATEVFARVRDVMDVDVAIRHMNAAIAGATADCAPMLRNIVLAAVPSIHNRDLERCIRLETSLTHCDPLSVDAAVAAAKVARGLANGLCWDNALAASKAGLQEEIVRAVESWETLPTDRTSYAPAVLQAALHFAGNSKSADEVFERSVSFSKENFIPVVACALAGARWGDGHSVP